MMEKHKRRGGEGKEERSGEANEMSPDRKPPGEGLGEATKLRLTLHVVVNQKSLTTGWVARRTGASHEPRREHDVCWPDKTTRTSQAGGQPAIWVKSDPVFVDSALVECLVKLVRDW